MFGWPTDMQTANNVPSRVMHDEAYVILVVDDDPAVRETSASMLEDLGYVVIQANGGPEALDVVERHPEVDLMVTDIRMPGMSGLELSDIATAKRRDLPVILISGYFAPQKINHRFLQKPFRFHELDAAIRAELVGRSTA